MIVKELQGPACLSFAFQPTFPQKVDAMDPMRQITALGGWGGQILPLDEVAGALCLPLTKSGNGDSNGTIEHVTPEETEGR